ncbi:hypothetical protein IPG41_04855 [Candidatus Peregrinibacteria bacterium]|nr:MAG: hypothetical protein IPG41_04855 [Candidatus Peregrinibacteria bacterium]
MSIRTYLLAAGLAIGGVSDSVTHAAHARETQGLGSLRNNLAEENSENLANELMNVDFKAAPRTQEILNELYRQDFISFLENIERLHTEAMQELLVTHTPPVVDGSLIASNGLLAGLKQEVKRVKNPELEVLRYEALLRMLEERRETLESVHLYWSGVQSKHSVAAGTAPDSPEGIAYNDAVEQQQLTDLRLNELAGFMEDVARNLETARGAEVEKRRLDLLEQANYIYAGYLDYGTDREEALEGLQEVSVALGKELDENKVKLEELARSSTPAGEQLAQSRAISAYGDRLLETLQQVEEMKKCLEDMAKVGNPMAGAAVTQETALYGTNDVATSNEADGDMFVAEVSAQPECPAVDSIEFTVQNPFEGITDPVFEAHTQAWLTQFNAAFAGGLAVHKSNDLSFTDELEEASRIASTNMAFVPETLYWSKGGKANDKVTEDLRNSVDLYSMPAEKVWASLAEKCDGPVDTCYDYASRSMIYAAARGERLYPEWKEGDASTAGQVCPADHFSDLGGVAAPMMRELCDKTRELLDSDGTCTMDGCAERGQKQGDGGHPADPYARIYLDAYSGMGVPNLVNNPSAVTDMAWTIARGEVAKDLNLSREVRQGERREERHE